VIYAQPNHLKVSAANLYHYGGIRRERDRLFDDAQGGAALMPAQVVCWLVRRVEGRSLHSGSH
jgi:hypothetical protein